jgi:hypothetical protein
LGEDSAGAAETEALACRDNLKGSGKTKAVSDEHSDNSGSGRRSPAILQGDDRPALAPAYCGQKHPLSVTGVKVPKTTE